jgi:hypothetical protein
MIPPDGENIVCQNAARRAVVEKSSYTAVDIETGLVEPSALYGMLASSRGGLDKTG